MDGIAVLVVFLFFGLFLWLDGFVMRRRPPRARSARATRAL